MFGWQHTVHRFQPSTIACYGAQGNYVSNCTIVQQWLVLSKVPACKVWLKLKLLSICTTKLSSKLTPVFAKMLQCVIDLLDNLQ